MLRDLLTYYGTMRKSWNIYHLNLLPTTLKIIQNCSEEGGMHIYSFSRRKIARLMDRLRVLQQGMRFTLDPECHRPTDK